MKLFFKKFLPITALTLIGVVNAQVVQKETPDALIIVSRPVDMWSPDFKFNQLILDIIKQKRSSFSYQEPNGKTTAIMKSLLSDPISAPVADIVYEKLKISGFKIGNNVLFTVQSPIGFSPSDLPEFIAAQNAVYAKSIEKSGNPDNLEGKESAKKFFGNLLSLATFIGVGEKFGYANANSAVIGNSVAFDIGASVQKFGKIIVPRPLPQADFTNYKRADIYRVTTLKTVGMVIIAYKEPKTLETEREALAEAIFSLTGADTTPKAIIKEREKDFATRKEIWAACVQRGDCSE
jgi:hypothetical protein